MALTPRDQFLAGMRAQVPNLAGSFPFGLAAGAFTVTVVNNAWLSIGMQAMMFAGRAQMVAMQLEKEHAPLVFMLLACLIINLRCMMYGTAIAQHFGHLSWPWKIGLSFMLADFTYAVSIKPLTEMAGTENAPTRHFFYLGAGLFNVMMWSTGGIIGAWLGNIIPVEWNLDFVPQVSFIFVLVTALRDRDDWLAGIAAGAVSVLLVGLPWQAGLFVGATTGLVAGMLIKPRIQEYANE